jgi:uncharacterized protein YcnI
MNRRLTLAAPALVLGALAPAVLLLASPASAHVTVNPDTATAGGYTKLTFRVPTESDTASTKRVEVYFPEDQPLASASVQPHPGWTYHVVDHKLATPVSSDDGQVTEAVEKIVWTADSAKTEIHPGEFDEFNVSVGPLPDTGTMVFKALQYYTDGSIVRWIDPTVDGQPEPEHPAPVLTLTPADGTATTTASTPTTDASSSASTSDDSRTPLVLSIIALVLAVGACALSVVSRRRS